MQAQGLVPCLKTAVEEIWSGAVRISDRGESIGEVVFSEGRIAWATCRGHPETLGVFLWRLGRLSHDELERLRGAFEAHRGQKKLGALAEELGLVSRPVLRRCLMLHTRSAINALLSHRSADGELAPSPPRTDEACLFEPAEVLPAELLASETATPRAHHAGQRWHERTSQNVVLDRLIAQPGHKASAVLSSEGEVIAGFTSSADVDLTDLGVFFAEAMEAASRVKADTPLQSIHGTAANGTWAARWLDPSQGFLVGLLLDEKGDASMTGPLLRRSVPAMITWLVRGGLLAEKDIAETARLTRSGRIEHDDELLAEAGDLGDDGYLPIPKLQVRSDMLSIDSYKMDLRYESGFSMRRTRAEPASHKRGRRSLWWLWVVLILGGSAAFWVVVLVLCSRR
jgi:hypothetical protein